MLYVQVINPNNNLLGEKGELVFENGILNYSAATKVFYENMPKPQDVTYRLSKGGHYDYYEEELWIYPSSSRVSLAPH